MIPNHVLTELRIKTKDKSEQNYLINILTSEVDSTPVIDFDKIIPEPTSIDKCPERYRITEHSHVSTDKDRPWFNWYEWHCDFWGTKWNAYDGDVIKLSDSVLFTFRTAWSPAMPIFRKLRLLELDFTVSYADEDIGSNCGRIEYFAESGDWYEQDASDLDDPDAFARELWGYEDEDEE